MKAALSQSAQRELSDILLHIREKDPIAARKLRKEFSRSFSLIAFQPGIGTLGVGGETRETFVRGNYRIVYRVEDDFLSVVRVIHTARQWPPSSTDQ